MRWNTDWARRPPDAGENPGERTRNQERAEGRALAAAGAPAPRRAGPEPARRRWCGGADTGGGDRPASARAAPYGVPFGFRRFGAGLGVRGRPAPWCRAWAAGRRSGCQSRSAKMRSGGTRRVWIMAGGGLGGGGVGGAGGGRGGWGPREGGRGGVLAVFSCRRAEGRLAGSLGTRRVCECRGGGRCRCPTKGPVAQEEVS